MPPTAINSMRTWVFGMKPDYGFALLCWTFVLGPAFLAIVNWNVWWLLLYVLVALIFGMA